MSSDKTRRGLGLPVDKNTLPAVERQEGGASAGGAPVAATTCVVSSVATESAETGRMLFTPSVAARRLKYVVNASKQQPKPYSRRSSCSSFNSIPSRRHSRVCTARVSSTTPLSLYFKPPRYQEKQMSLLSIGGDCRCPVSKGDEVSFQTLDHAWWGMAGGRTEDLQKTCKELACGQARSSACVCGWLPQPGANRGRFFWTAKRVLETFVSGHCIHSILKGTLRLRLHRASTPSILFG